MDILSVKQRFGIIGTSEIMNRSLEVAVRVASTDLSVLVTGESGVGKEFFPQIIHAFSARKHNKYIAVNCGAIPEGTIDSELFGHEKGAFTGASESRKGYFEEANGGTIFLDEVGELPLSTQVRLLRVLQTGEYIRVGSSKTQKTNVRVVAATNANLVGAIANGRFREDLYYRLNTVPINVPPLRDRKEDVYMLFRRFASDVATQYRMPPIVLDEGARLVLESYSWPGNIRQLKNVAEQISAIEESRAITEQILRRYLNIAPASSPIILGSGRASDNSDEREILYKVLFEMRHDISELKRMVAELGAGTGLGNGGINSSTSGLTGALSNVSSLDRKSEIVGLLPSSYRHQPASSIVTPMTSANHNMSEAEPLFADSEEVTEEPAEEMTKERAQRDSIIKALKRNNGKRRDAARELFISERTLYRKIKELGIDEFR